jgi:hypothetical protein
MTHNRTQHWCNLLRSKAYEFFREKLFPGDASPPARFGVQVVYGLRVKIRQIASRGLKQD